MSSGTAKTERRRTESKEALELAQLVKQYRIASYYAQGGEISDEVKKMAILARKILGE